MKQESSSPGTEIKKSRSRCSRGVPAVAASVLLVLSVLIGNSAVTATEDGRKILTDHWTTEEGLPQNSVTAITRTDDGFMWLGTFGGLTRFDGSNFRTFTHENTEGLSGHRVNDLFKDRSGTLWIATQDGGLSRHDGEGFINETESLGLDTNYVTSVTGTADGTLWIGTDRGIAMISGGSTKILTSKNGLPDDFVTAVRAAEDGSVWIGTARGLASWRNGKLSVPWVPGDGKAFGVICLCSGSGGVMWAGSDRLGLLKCSENSCVQFVPDSGGEAGRSFAPIWVVWREPGGSLLLGTGDGLIRFREDSFFRAPDRMLSGSAGMMVRSIFGDDEGGVWVGTDGKGLFKYHRARIWSYGKEDGLPGESVLPIVPDKDGSVLIGTPSSGIARIRSGAISAETGSSSLVKDAAWSLCPSRDGSLWIGTWGGGLVRKDAGRSRVLTKKDGLPSDVVLAVYEDRQGAIWVGTNKGIARISKGMIDRFDKTTGFAGNVVCCITEDRSGTIWAGTYEGMSCFRDGKFSSLTTKDGLSCNHVRWIYEDAEGVFWIATYGGGINRYRNGSFSHASMKNGLIDDSLSMIIEDRWGNLWISSNRGVMRIPKSDLNELCEGRSAHLTVAYFTKSEGMPSSECNGGGQPAGCVAPDGKIWFPTIKGAVAFDPEMKDIKPPAVVVEEIAVNRGEPGRASEFQEFGPGTHTVEIRFGAVCTSDPEAPRFKFRLDGVDDDWVEAGERDTAYYTELHPGTYRFRVMACNSDAVWSGNEASVSIRLKPYVHQTWYFYLLCILMLSALLTSLVRYRIVSLRRKAQELETLVKERTMDLEEQKGALAIVNDELTRSHGDLQEILEHLRTGVAIIGSDGRIEFLNNTTQTFLGVDKESFVGQDWREIFPFTGDSAKKLSVHMLGGQDTDAMINATMELPDGKLFLTEMEVVSHPRLRNQKIVYFHEMTEAYRLKDSKESGGDGTRMMIGQSPAILKIYRSIEELAKVDTTVLIRGETGSGKEVIARAIHRASPRKDKPFVAINCAGLTETVLASQLFGHKKGSFTGAVSDQVGLIEAAAGGTLLLDEIGDMSLEVQRTLLRVLQEKEIVRLGETSARHVDLRFIAATHRDLEKQVIEGSFRQDLLYRIKIAEIIVPPLRERIDDIPLLANSFLQEFKEPGGAVYGFSREAMETMIDYGWPGNVRELRSAVESAVVRSRGAVIMPENIPIAITGKNYRESADEPGEQDRLIRALKENKGNIIKAARKLGVTRMTIYRWISRYKIDIEKYR